MPGTPIDPSIPDTIGISDHPDGSRCICRSGRTTTTSTGGGSISDVCNQSQHHSCHCYPRMMEETDERGEEPSVPIPDSSSVVVEPPVELYDQIIAMLEHPSQTTWLNVIFAIEGKKLDLHSFNEASLQLYKSMGSVQAVLNAKTTPDVSDSSMIVPFVEGNLSKKKKVNCLGSAMAASLIANSAGLSYKTFCSENHSWIELSGGVRVDVNENLKAAKKSKRPLYIYSNPQEMNPFSLCMLHIVNKNSLSDSDEFSLLQRYQNRLCHSWEFSKLFSLANKFERLDSIPRDLLHRDPISLGLLVDRIMYNIEDEEDALAALSEMEVLVERITKLCCSYSVDSDWWLHSKGSFLKICEDFTSEFRGQANVGAIYEEWVDKVSALALDAVPQAHAKFSKSVPTFSGKRRRVDKERC